MRKFIGRLPFAAVLIAVIVCVHLLVGSQVLSQAVPVTPIALQFHPVNVQVGGSIIAAVYGIPSSGYVDARFRSPGTNIDQIALNWQRGAASAHDIPIDTVAGEWTITGVRWHANPNDHSADFIPVFASLTVNAIVRVASAFVPTSRMIEGRTGHTATLLSDGRVLVAGGSWRNLRSAELYDPQSGTFSSVGMMVSPRSWHTATLLSNGKVLLTGGYELSGRDVQSSAELYNPASGTFSPTGSMTIPLAGHTATLLQDGRVLIVGGRIACCPAFDQAQLYDPTTERFTNISRPLLPPGATANLLMDGRVFFASGPGTPDLAVGRFGAGQLYDPKPATFSYVGDPNLTYSPVGHTATLLTNGKVLLTGGEIEYFLFYSASAGLFDAMTEDFLPLGKMSSTRSWHTATLLPDSRVLVAGGQFAGSQFPTVNSAEVYDPSSGRFSLVGNVTTGRSAHTATLLRTGAVLLTGGDGVAGTAELYYPAFGPPEN